MSESELESDASLEVGAAVSLLTGDDEVVGPEDWAEVVLEELVALVDVDCAPVELGIGGVVATGVVVALLVVAPVVVGAEVVVVPLNGFVAPMAGAAVPSSEAQLAAISAQGTRE